MQRFVSIRHYRVCWWRTNMRLCSTLVRVDAETDAFREGANYWTPPLQIEGMEQGITSLTSARHRINPGKSFAVCIYPVNIDRRIIVRDLLHDRVNTVIRQRRTKYTRMVKLSSGATTSLLMNKSVQRRLSSIILKAPSSMLTLKDAINDQLLLGWLSFEVLWQTR